MAAPTTVQEARKQAQIARLKKKKNLKTEADTKAYLEYYASQPFQVERKAEGEKYLAAVRVANKAAEVLKIAEITGDGLEDAKANAAVTALMAQNAKPPSRTAGMGSRLSGATI